MELASLGGEFCQQRLGCRSLETCRGVPTEPIANRHRPASRSSTRRRWSTAAATPPRPASATPSQVSADIFRDGHEVLRAVVRWRAPGDDAGGSEAPMRHVDAAPRRRALGGRVHRRPPRPLGVDDRGLGRRASPRGARSCSARSTPARRTSPASCPRARCCSSTAAERAKGEDTRHARARRCQRRRGRRPADARPRRRRAGRRRRRRRRPPSRPQPSPRSLPKPLRARRRPRARPLRLLVRAVPALVGRLRGRRASSSPRLAELGFDVLYLPPIHPIGRTNRKGRNNALVGRPRRPRQPVGDRRRDGRPHGDPPRPRHDRGLRRARRRRPASTASRSRSTSRSSARPTTPGSPSTPSGSTAAPTAR